jgi:hypothetical protein
MKKYQFIVSLLICFGLVCFLSSCDKEDEVIDLGNENALIVSESVFQNAPNDPFSLHNVKIDGDILTIKISASGCDGGRWKVNIITLKGYAKSNPPQRDLRISFENNEDCLAYIGKEFSFNIKNLRVEGTNRVWLNILGSGILYEY